MEMKYIFLKALMLVILQINSAKAAEITCIGRETVGPYHSSNGLYFTLTLERDQIEGRLSNYISRSEGERRPIDTSALFQLEMEFSSNNGNSRCLDLLLRGNIVRGDFEKISNLTRRPNIVRRVFLVSQGGIVSESIRIGELLRNLGVETIAPDLLTHEVVGNRVARRATPYIYLAGPNILDHSLICSGSQNCICASACVLVWASGINRTGNHLGLHRPSFSDQGSGNLSLQDAQELYRRTEISMRSYLSRMEIPDHMINIIMNTDSRRLFIPVLSITEFYSGNWGGGRPRSIEEWVRLYCPARSEPTSAADFLEEARTYSEENYRVEGRCNSKLWMAERARRYLSYWRM